MSVEFINPSTMASPRGYTHVVKHGSTVYIAGQVARDKEGKTVGVGDAKAQIEQVFKNLEAALAEVGGTLGHIAKTTIYMTRREDFPAFRAMREKYFPGDKPPASTLILCSGLADPDFLIEIEVVAVMP